MVEWMFHNGEHIPFLQELQSMGRETQLDTMPILGDTEQELWEVYCFAGGDNIILNLDIYADRIGLPHDWSFKDCAVLLSKMARKRAELEKQKRDQNG